MTSAASAVFPPLAPPEEPLALSHCYRITLTPDRLGATISRQVHPALPIYPIRVAVLAAKTTDRLLDRARGEIAADAQRRSDAAKARASVLAWIGRLLGGSQ